MREDNFDGLLQAVEHATPAISLAVPQINVLRELEQLDLEIERRLVRPHPAHVTLERLVRYAVQLTLHLLHGLSTANSKIKTALARVACLSMVLGEEPDEVAHGAVVLFMTSAFSRHVIGRRAHCAEGSVHQ